MQPETSAHRDIDSIARSQGGHITRAQLLGAGLARSTVRRRVGSGMLLPVGHRTFRLPSHPRSARGDVLAACLDTGGIASHWTAAWLHGLLPPRALIDVTVPRNRPSRPAMGEGPRSERIRVHVSTNLPDDDITRIEQVPTTSAARTMLGLGALVPAEMSERKLFDVVSDAVDKRLATDPWLWWMLTQRRCRGRNGVLALEQVLAERARLGPTESWLEREALRLLEAGGLALPATQRVIRRAGRFAARVDLLYEPRLVLEVMGYAFHRTEAQLSRDLARANELQLLGFEVYQFTARQLVSAPDSFVATVCAALAQQPRLAA